MSKWKGWGAVLLAAVVMGSCNMASDEEQATSASSSSPTIAPVRTAPPRPTPTPSPNLFDTPAPTTTAAQQAGERVEVGRVIDGDTFELTDGRKVRVLGIDSCEMKGAERYGGEQAKSEAERLLTFVDPTVTLIQEPGVDRDRFGRLLRYVKVDGKDFGQEMVQWDHTGIYDPKNNDASKEYLDQLYALDTKFSLNPPSGRECGDPYPDISSGGNVDVDIDRDDDDDRESRFCRKRWWC